MGRKKDFISQKFWVRSYHVSIVGRDAEVIRNDSWHQEDEDRRIDQLNRYHL